MSIRVPRRSPTRVLTIGALAAILLAPISAFAADHNYSTAYEQDVDHYSGLSLTRFDGDNIVAGTGGCNSYFAGNPIYQTMWVQTTNAHDWVEFGVGHQCGGSKTYRFWGYADDDVWHPVGNVDITPGGARTYTIDGDGTGVWRWRLDGAQQGSMFWASRHTFGHTAAGLESYAPGGSAPAYRIHELQYQQGTSTTWHDWNGRDAVRVDDPPMCGTWNSDTDRRVGQEASC